MKPYHSLDEVHLKGTWLTIGSFDGVHLGHQSVVKQLVEQAHVHGAPAAVITFHPHPALVLGKRIGPYYLTEIEERIALLEALGIDAVIVHPFDLQVARLSAETFMQRLKDALDVQQLWVGHDFALGHNREGDVARLREIGKKLDYQLHLVDAFTLDGEVVSSSRIRRALAEGEVGIARRLLGRYYTVEGEVIPGDARGRLIGIPTANLSIWKERFLPQGGVYACFAEYGGKWFQSVVNIGVRPTFDGRSTRVHVEAHLLDFAEEIYGEKLKLFFVARLRAEQRFDTANALVDQINKDIKQAKQNLLAEQDR